MLRNLVDGAISGEPPPAVKKTAKWCSIVSAEPLIEWRNRPPLSEEIIGEGDAEKLGWLV